MSTTCLDLAPEYRKYTEGVTKSKKSLVVVFFFIYCAYTVCLIGKHVLKHCDNRKELQKFHEKFARLQDDMLGKTFFVYFLLMLCSQVTPNFFVALLGYCYLGALGV